LRDVGKQPPLILQIHHPSGIGDIMVSYADTTEVPLRITTAKKGVTVDVKGNRYGVIACKEVLGGNKIG